MRFFLLIMVTVALCACGNDSAGTGGTGGAGGAGGTGGAGGAGGSGGTGGSDGFWQWNITPDLAIVDQSADVTDLSMLEVFLGNSDISHSDATVQAVKDTQLILSSASWPEPLGFETVIDLTLPDELPLTVGETVTIDVPGVDILLRDRVVTVRDTQTLDEATLTTLHYTDTFLGWSLHSRRELVIRDRTTSADMYQRYTYADDVAAPASATLPDFVRTFQWLEAPAYSVQNHDTLDATGFVTASDVDGQPVLTLEEVAGSDFDGMPVVNVHDFNNPANDHSFTFDRGFANVRWWQSHLSPDLQLAHVPMTDTDATVVVADLGSQTQQIVPLANAPRAAPLYVSHDGQYATSITNEDQSWAVTVAFTLASKDESDTTSQLTYDVDMRLHLDNSYVEVTGTFEVYLFFAPSDFD